jgi:tetratricopeptide (TPR) repeat protein
MNFNISRIFVSCALGLAVAFVVAQQAAGAQMTPAQRQEMMEHYERATRAYDVQKYQEAVAEYQKAYEIGGDPAMLYNVAQAYRLGDQLTEALHTYRRYLQRSPSARNREDVERKISDLEQTIEARRKAAEAAAAQAKQATDTTPPPPAAAPAVPPPPPPGPPIETGVNGLRVAGIAVLSVGAAALATAGVAGSMASKRGDDLTQASIHEQAFDPGVQSSGKTWNTIAIASAVGGGALAVVGTILIVAAGSGEPERAPTTTARLLPVMGGAGSGSLWGMGAAFAF